MMTGVHQLSAEVHAVQTASLYSDCYSVTVVFEVAVLAFE